MFIVTVDAVTDGMALFVVWLFQWLIDQVT